MVSYSIKRVPQLTLPFFAERKLAFLIVVLVLSATSVLASLALVLGHGGELGSSEYTDLYGEFPTSWTVLERIRGRLCRDCVFTNS